MYLLQVLASPTRTFEKLREKGGWVLALIVVCVLTAGAVFVQWPVMEATIVEEMEKAQAGVPAEQMDMIMTFSKYSAIGGSVIGPIFMMFFVGLLLFLLNLIVRGEGKYMQFAKVALYSGVPPLLGSLLTAAMAVALGANTIYDVTLSAGAFFPEKSGFWFTLASAALNPFALWGLALTVIGTAVMSRRSIRTVGIWIVVVWLLIQVGSSASALFAA
ncbi:YIP1 family protein [Paenibacillus sp. TRM 82003]|nr:YIP1 family protein [Paenibacillus sp. TRM 82003]